MMPLRLLYVLENYWPHVGGVENGFRALCVGMAARGHHVRVLTTRQPGAPAREGDGGVEIIRVAALNSRYAFTFAAVPHVVREARAADIIHTTTYNAAPPAWLGGRIAGVPVVLTVNETWIGRWGEYTNFGRVKATLHDFLERLVFVFPFDTYCAISKSTADRFRELFPHRASRTQTVYYGFDPAPWQGTAVSRVALRELGYRDDDFVVLGYGRPGASKGFEFLVDAWPKIAATLPRAKLLLILSEASQYARELAALKRRATSTVSFLPSQSFGVLTRLVAGSNCAVIPSVVEGFGFTTLEACAAGVPVVASDTTSIPEVIGGRYRLVPTRDAAAIADAVIAIHDNDVVERPLRTFCPEEMLDKYESIYEYITRSRVKVSSWDAERELKNAPA